MKAVVVDACVAAKWVVNEDDSDKAISLLLCETRYAPAHWVTEAVNVIWSKVLLGRMSAAKAPDRMDAIMRAPVGSVPVADLMPRALALSIAHSVTIYDSLYVALSALRDLPLVTADRRLIRAVASDPALARRLVWVGDLASA